MKPRLRIAALALLASAGCGAAGNQPGFAYLPEMFRSVAVEAYDRNPVLRGGQTLQHPPAGTIPLEGGVTPYGAGPEEARRAGLELTNPLPPTAESLARGQQVWSQVCVVCHGPTGQGDGPVIGAGRFPNPPSLLAARARQMPDGQVFHVITRGQGIMPAHAAQVLPADRWSLVHHLRQLQGAQP